LEWYNAIVLPKREEEARAIVHLSLLSLAAFTALLILTIPFANPIAALFKSPQLATYYWMLPLYVCLMGIWNVLNYWYIRRKAYGRISGYQISQSLFSAGYKTGFGWFGILNAGLLYSSILSPLCSLLISVSLSAKKHLKILCTWDFSECKKAATDYANFPKYSAPRALLNNLSGNLPILMLSPAFGLTEIGFIGMALTLALMPIQIIVRSIYQVLYQHITQKVNDRQIIHTLLLKYISIVTLTVIPSFALLYIILPWLTAFLLGDAWYITGEYIRILLPWIIMIILTSSTNFIPDIFGKQRILLWVEIVYLILRVSALLIGIYSASITTALLLFSLAGFTVLAGQLIWFITLAYKHDNSITDASNSQ
jgi:O-antigen/teichoic acid export membrane protein